MTTSRAADSPEDRLTPAEIARLREAERAHRRTATAGRCPECGDLEERRRTERELTRPDRYEHRGPPQLLTPEGELAVYVQGRFEVEDRPAAEAALARRLTGVPGGYAEIVGTRDGPWVRALLWLASPDELWVEATSVSRFTSVKYWLEGLWPPVWFRMSGTVNVRDMGLFDAAELAARARPPGDEVRAALSALVERQERRWLDDPSPLLRGRTPRAAVRSRSGRQRVLHLLETGRHRPPAEVGMVHSFDAGRVRGLLGSEPQDHR